MPFEWCLKLGRCGWHCWAMARTEDFFSCQKSKFPFSVASDGLSVKCSPPPLTTTSRIRPTGKPHNRISSPEPKIVQIIGQPSSTCWSKVLHREPHRASSSRLFNTSPKPPNGESHDIQRASSAILRHILYRLGVKILPWLSLLHRYLLSPITLYCICDRLQTQGLFRMLRAMLHHCRP